MKSEVIVDVRPKEIAIALLEDKRLVEFQQETRAVHFSVGNIYLAKVKRLSPGMNACFANVGYEHDAFLHYTDLGKNFYRVQEFLKDLGQKKEKKFPSYLKTNELEKEGSIANVLQKGDEVLVQIAKEPISTKGPRLTCDISFAGRNVVLIPFSKGVHVSTKIKNNARRATLKTLISKLLPQGFGIIVRTAAEEASTKDLYTEIETLHANWNAMVKKIRSLKQKQNAPALPQLVFEESSRTVSLLRDLYDESYENIYVNDADTFREVQNYLSVIAPTKTDVVKRYTGKVPIFDNFGVSKQVKSSLDRVVTYKGGAYLVIEHTEAMHVVDVNSGNRTKKAEDQETNAFDTNLGAAEELARQLRLRDMGGIIVVDFIDMQEEEHRQKLYEQMVEAMKGDRARHKILPLSKFGLMQITRQRVRPAQDVSVEEACPTCGGTGKTRPAILFTDMLESKVKQLTEELNYKRLRLHVHPYVAAYLTKGLAPLSLKWQFKYKARIRVVADQMMSYLQYEFRDADGEEIDMHTAMDN